MVVPVELGMVVSVDLGMVVSVDLGMVVSVEMGKVNQVGLGVAVQIDWEMFEDEEEEEEEEDGGVYVECYRRATPPCGLCHRVRFARWVLRTHMVKLALVNYAIF